jgi:Tfp pilus assembly protein FimT
MKNTLFKASKGAGFTVVEVLITVIVAALFVLSITQLSVTQTKLTSTMTTYGVANLLSYNNLRTYAYGKSPNWFECVYSSGNPQPMTLLTSTSSVSGLPSPVSQTVVATAPYGCGGDSSSIGYPIRVVSTVTYGPSAKVVVHATYSTY